MAMETKGVATATTLPLFVTKMFSDYISIILFFELMRARFICRLMYLKTGPLAHLRPCFIIIASLIDISFYFSTRSLSIFFLENHEHPHSTIYLLRRGRDQHINLFIYLEASLDGVGGGDDRWLAPSLTR